MNKNKPLTKTELLAPAGDYKKAITALKYGADAVFLGGKAYSLRSQASNFFMQDILNTCNQAHQWKKKVYVALNVICHNALLAGFKKFMADLVQTGVDALIVADPFIIDYVYQTYPNLEMHLSTQQSVTNSMAAKFWKNNGLSRIVLGREVSMNELTLLMENTRNVVEIECFIHGAVCISYSGRCMMSNNWSLRDSNVGGCAQSCRWLFDLKNAEQTITYNAKFTMSPKDMMLLDEIKKMMELGVASFKIEGRMRSVNYVATVVKSYRTAIDNFYRQKQSDSQEKEMLKKLKKDLKYAENRPTSIAFSKGQPTVKAMLYNDRNQDVKQIFAFMVLKKVGNLYEVISHNNFQQKQIFSIIGPKVQIDKIKIKNLYDENKKLIDVAKTPMRKYYIEFAKKVNLKPNDIGRIENK